jgi:hypothetical protein
MDSSKLAKGRMRDVNSRWRRGVHALKKHTGLTFTHNDCGPNLPCKREVGKKEQILAKIDGETLKLNGRGMYVGRKRKTRRDPHCYRWLG